MNYRDSNLRDVLTREFVLGTMSRRARRRFSRAVDEDESLAEAIYALEEKLLPMAWSLKPVQPSELVWQRIAREAGIGSGPAVRAAASTTRWPLVATALSVALIAAAIGWWQESRRPPDIVVETVTETVPVEPSISVVADEGGNALWLARIYSDLQRVDVAVQNAPTQYTSNDYELWALRDDGVPVSLGLLPQTGATSLTLADNALDALQRASVLAVSLEPTGGSPAATPTGPVLYTAELMAP